MHSLLYYSTATSGVKFTHIPEFVDMTVIDGEAIASYDSFSQDVTLKTDLADTVDKESETMRAKDTEIYLKAQLYTLKERLSQTEGESTHSSW